MCGSEGSWVEEGWKLFADLKAATHREAADADAPLRRDAEEPASLPGIPLS
jgi:hypothetical protein